MKKFTLMLCLVTVFNIKSDAQTENQLSQGNIFIDSKKDLLMSNNDLFRTMNSIEKTGPTKDYDYYMHKCKNNRTVGWVTLGAGVVLSGIGILVANGDYATNDSGSSTAGVLTVIGAASGIVSIPFMIMASVYKHKAKAMVSSQKTGFGVPANVNKDIVGITLQIPLGK